MCRNAGEIQEQWTFQYGDYILDPRDDSVEVWSGYSASDFPGYPTKKYDGGVWLPRLDQLIELSGMMWQEFMISLMQTSSRLEITIEKAGLAFLMFHKYGKKWEDNGWVIK
jgi:hypothetical protein